MEAKVYKEMIEQQDQHWWFQARREILESMIVSLNLPVNAEILEIGCGTGGNISMLQKYGQVTAIELDEYARSYTSKSTGVQVHNGALPDDIPDELNKKYDLIVMFDVLEHIEQDVDSLITLKTMIKRDGYLLLTVPAYQWMFGIHDINHHHFRRYEMDDIQTKFKTASLSLIRKSYFNSLLFPLVAMIRLLEKIKKPHKDSLGFKTPNKITNSILYHIFKFEKKLLKMVNLPMGASLMVLAK